MKFIVYFIRKLIWDHKAFSGDFIKYREKFKNNPPREVLPAYFFVWASERT